MNQNIDPKTYQSYRGLPPLAGLTTFERAAQPGLSVEQCVARLKRLHYALVRLHEIFTARITSEPIYELKNGYSLHAYLCAEHITAIRTRVSEMREPPLGLEDVPSEQLQIFFDEILAASSTQELLLGLYEKALPAFDRELERYLAETHPLCDAPSVRICRFARLEVADMLSFGQQCLAALVDGETRAKLADWLTLLDACLDEAGPPVQRQRSVKPYVYDPVPKRDERFQDLWNQGVNAEAFLYDESFDPRSKTLMMFFKRLREIDVPEMMASIIIETRGKPWKYYRDMTRQLWDEARHAMMGEVGFVANGIDWTKARITHNWSTRLNTECTALERHAVLFFIEQGLMTRTGKRYEWEIGVASGSPLAGVFQDFDWADEVLHSQIGREWYVTEIGDLKKALDYGDACWSKILSNWAEVRERGWTQHENWWPAIYQQACQSWGITPDARVLAYSTTYEDQRADLKSVSTSA